MQIQEAVLDYGQVELGFAFTKAIVVNNDGDAPLVVSVTNLSAANPDLGQWSDINVGNNFNVAVGGDPLTDISAAADIYLVIADGQVLLEQLAQKARRPGVIALARPNKREK